MQNAAAALHALAIAATASCSQAMCSVITPNGPEPNTKQSRTHRVVGAVEAGRAGRARDGAAPSHNCTVQSQPLGNGRPTFHFAVLLSADTTSNADDVSIPLLAVLVACELISV